MCRKVLICNTYAHPQTKEPINDAALIKFLKHCRTYSSKHSSIHSAVCSLFKYNFIVMPLYVLDSHWAVAIIVDAPSLVEDGPTRTIILILDSLPGSPPSDPYALRPDHIRAARRLTKWLAHLAQYRPGNITRAKDIRYERVPFVSPALRFLFRVHGIMCF